MPLFTANYEKRMGQDGCLAVPSVHSRKRALWLNWTEKVCGCVPSHCYCASALGGEDRGLGRQKYWSCLWVECYSEDFPVAAVISVGSGSNCSYAQLACDAVVNLVEVIDAGVR